MAHWLPLFSWADTAPNWIVRWTSSYWSQKRRCHTSKRKMGLVTRRKTPGSSNLRRSTLHQTSPLKNVGAQSGHMHLPDQRPFKNHKWWCPSPSTNLSSGFLSWNSGTRILTSPCTETHLKESIRMSTCPNTYPSHCAAEACRYIVDSIQGRSSIFSVQCSPQPSAKCCRYITYWGLGRGGGELGEGEFEGGGRGN